MKTLDEVLEAIKTKSCLKLSSRRKDDRWVVPIDLWQEVIYYLREYQRDKQIYSYDIARRNLEIAERNDPLTWDELKTMTGKPVWVEYESCNRKEWAIIDCFYTDAFQKVKMNVALPHDYWNLEKEMMGVTWQAYRKERK